MTIKGKKAVEKACSANFNVVNQDVTCLVQTEANVEKVNCLLWRTEGNDGMNLIKVSGFLVSISLFERVSLASLNLM